MYLQAFRWDFVVRTSLSLATLHVHMVFLTVRGKKKVSGSFVWKLKPAHIHVLVNSQSFKSMVLQISFTKKKKKKKRSKMLHLDSSSGVLNRSSVKSKECVGVSLKFVLMYLCS